MLHFCQLGFHGKAVLSQQSLQGVIALCVEDLLSEVIDAQAKARKKELQSSDGVHLRQGRRLGPREDKVRGLCDLHQPLKCLDDSELSL
jgi:hypothetical protein